MINVTARFAVKEGRAEDFEALVASVRDAFLADDGCLRYDLQRDRKNELGYVLLETYDSSDALRRHGAMQEFADFGGAVATMLTGEPEIHLLVPVGKQIALAS